MIYLRIVWESGHNCETGFFGAFKEALDTLMNKKFNRLAKGVEFNDRIIQLVELE